MDILIIVLQVLLSLSILVITHEGGHFFFAKLFGTRVEKFYLFFDPWFSLFKFQKGETEYGIGWVPLGGYVKIAGMIDESMDTDQMKQPEQPWEFRAKPAWQRLFIMLGGIIVNLLTAPILFWMILYTWGETYMPINEAPYGLQFHQTMLDAGFKNGDLIVGVDGDSIETYKDVANPILFKDTCIINVVRNGERIDIQMPHEFYRQVLANDVSALLTVRVPIVIDSLISDGGAAKAGMQKGDKITSIDGKGVFSFTDLITELNEKTDTTITLTCIRKTGETDTLQVTTDSNARIGISLMPPSNWIPFKHRDFGFFAALPAGVSKGYDLLCNYIKQLPMLFTKEGATKVGGFGTIGKLFPTVWDWESFWFNTAFLAIMLAVMNALPIPALDGGHVLFLIIEIITGKKASDKVLEVAQTIGMVLLLALMLYANGADIVRAIFD